MKRCFKMAGMWCMWFLDNKVALIGKIELPVSHLTPTRGTSMGPRRYGATVKAHQGRYNIKIWWLFRCLGRPKRSNVPARGLVSIEIRPAQGWNLWTRRHRKASPQRRSKFTSWRRVTHGIAHLTNWSRIGVIRIWMTIKRAYWWMETVARCSSGARRQSKRRRRSHKMF